MLDRNETWKKLDGNKIELPPEKVTLSSEKLFQKKCCVGHGLKLPCA